MAEESGDLRGIGPQHPQALNAQIGNAEMVPARVQWRSVLVPKPEIFFTEIFTPMSSSLF